MVFEYLDAIDHGYSDDEFLDNIAKFLKDNLNIKLPSGFEGLSKDEKITYFRQKLNRPIRLCGVVNVWCSKLTVDCRSQLYDAAKLIGHIA